jgi:hypothetical protein
MDDFMAAVSAIGSGTVAPRTEPPAPGRSDTASLPPASATTRSAGGAAFAEAPSKLTRQLGSASGEPVLHPSRASSTQVFGADEGTDLIDDPRRVNRLGGSSSKVVLAAVGVAVGVIGAAAWALTRKHAEPAPIVPAAVVAPPPAPVAAPAAPPPAPVAEPAPVPPEAPSAEEPRGERERQRGKKGPGYRRITAPIEEAPASPPADPPTKPEKKPSPTPIELKPFPNL